MADPTTSPITAGSLMQIGETILQGVTDHEGLINTIAGMAGILT